MPLPNQAAPLETSTSGTPDLLGAPLESGNSVDNSQTSTGVEAGTGDSGLPEADMADNISETPEATGQAVEAARESLVEDIINARQEDSKVTEGMLREGDDTNKQVEEQKKAEKALKEKLEDQTNIRKVESRIEEIEARIKLIEASQDRDSRKEYIEYRAAADSLKVDLEEIKRKKALGLKKLLAPLDAVETDSEDSES
jgi:hypothetical protein